uniref:Uncharacterized protein n=1 Tax=Physcomitrium patens TaxID=3218 RepID=A0A2K1KPX7_PHYPA|nr:hypothetical protein PHYPA_006741 [Physcomitrium patens]
MLWFRTHVGDCEKLICIHASLEGLDVVVQVEKLLEDQVERNTPIEKEAQDNFHHLGPAPSQLQCVIFIIGLIVFTFMLELSLVFVCVG